MISIKDMGSPYRYNQLKAKFDIIGDLHGCVEELKGLLVKLGYAEEDGLYISHEGRMPVFCGDLTDRGKYSVETVKLIYKLFDKDLALYVPGNHCNKLYRYLCGSRIKIANGLETTIAEIERLDEKEKNNFCRIFLRLYENSSLYLVLDDGNLVVSHAGIKENMIGEVSERVKSQCLYGDVNGEVDEMGHPIRKEWFRVYSGKPLNVFGHTPVFESKIINNTINIDQGCVFGWRLAALNYPERGITYVQSTYPRSSEQFERMKRST